LSHNQRAPNPRSFITKGKLDQLSHLISAKDAEIVIFDDELSPSQQRNLHNALKVKVIDRTALILDIFSQRAHSSEGKLQVELAQLNYLLPRLRGRGIELSRLGGGIGTRGPGETKLEVDRRKIRKRISQLEQKIEKLATRRTVQRKKRTTGKVFNVALIGYTNSGKSTFLNNVTNSNVLVKDMLFSTLDSTTRRIEPFHGEEVLITDTVGFIEKLPHQLIAAFRSTLEEVIQADLLLLIVDISNPDYKAHISSVNSVLKEIGVSHKPVLIVFNKIDKITGDHMRKIQAKHQKSVFISALKKIGFEELFEKVRQIAEKKYTRISLKIPYSDNKMLSSLHSRFNILSTKYLDDGVILVLKASEGDYKSLENYIYKGTLEEKDKNTLKVLP